MSSLRSAIEPNIYIIDHVSYHPEEDQEQQFSEVVTKAIKITGDLKKPHLTVAYSPEPIVRFPLYRELDGEKWYEVSSSHVITLIDEGVYDVIIDHHETKHLVLSLAGNKEILNQFNYFHEEREAVWFLGEYSPFLILESNTEYTKESILTLPALKYRLDFNWVRFSRFAEYQ